MRKNENGRSMIEMLGVLAIIGVLSVGGIYGYTVAMRKYRANEIVQTASMLATLAHSKNAGDGGCVTLADSGLNGNPGGVAVSMVAAAPTTAAGVKVVNVTIGNATDTDLCNAITSIAPNAAPTAATDASARAGYYVTCQTAAAGTCS